ncbi:MAG: hypothetical protein IJ083_12805 [Clostridia bacterium]|nr:hypothetical protein [Clostridia bacterium]
MHITLAPVSRSGALERLQVEIRLTQPARAGEKLCSFQRETVSVRAPEPESLRLRDDLGDIPFDLIERTEYPIVCLDLVPGRESAGPLTLAYALTPSMRETSGRHGPYFQFAEESGGGTAPGIALLPDVPGYDGPVNLSWDLSGLPQGSRGICTWGEGDLQGLPLGHLRQCYYAMGPVKSLIDGSFGFYWLTEPPFDVAEIARFTGKLFGIMQRFFHDTESVYRIFMREDFTESSGGTALMRSYMFGWNRTQQVSLPERQNLLAHEMVHNWPHLHDEPYGTTTWYEEGTAEFYSIQIPLREGLISPNQALHEIQTRTDAYFTNPTRHLSDAEAAGIAWQDRRAQRLSYGRGVFFLAHVDAAIRRATAGRASIDDVVLELLEKGRGGEDLSNGTFLETVKAVSGLDVSGELSDLRAGKPFRPDRDSFMSLFDFEETAATEQGTGETVPSFLWHLREEKE